MQIFWSGIKQKFLMGMRLVYVHNIILSLHQPTHRFGDKFHGGMHNVIYPVILTPYTHPLTVTYTYFMTLLMTNFRLA